MSKISPQAAADSCMQFADCVGLKKAAAHGKNFVFSPLSIRAALSLAAAGSNGRTLDQFLSFLGSDSIEDLNSATLNLFASVRAATDSNPNPNPREDWDGEPSKVSLVNSVWVERTLTLKPAFKETAATVYSSGSAGTKYVDFRKKAPEAAKKVNAWVERKTNGLIKELIPRGALNESTTIILVNALYFKGPWACMFDTLSTRYDKFHLLNGNSVQVPFMTDGTFSKCIASCDSFKVLKLWYEDDLAGREFSMLVFLPDKIDGLRDLVQEAVSDPTFISRHAPTQSVKVGRFAVPKFKVSCGFEPSKLLPDLGLDLPFDKGNAEFEEMVVSPADPSFKLFISCVRHKATIEVTEEGTEASAATDVELEDVGCCLYEDPTPRVDFVADHPFMFVIREEKTGAVLFFGHVVDPSVEETKI